MNQLKKRLVEVDEILSYLSEEDIYKIPEEVRQFIRENKDNKYTWKYDETKKLKDQDVDRNTIVILSYLNSEYLLNEEQKELMEQIYELNEQKARKELIKRQRNIKPEDMLKNAKEKNGNTMVVKEENKEIIVKKESFLKKLITKIRSKIYVHN